MHTLALILSLILMIPAYAVSKGPTRRTFLQGAVAGSALPAMPKVTNPLTLTAETERAYRVYREMTAPTLFTHFFEGEERVPKAIWSHILGPQDQGTFEPDYPSNFYSQFTAMELDLAKKYQTSPLEIFKATRLILFESELVKALFADNMEELIPRFFDDAYIQEYLSRVAAFNPDLARSIRAEANVLFGKPTQLHWRVLDAIGFGDTRGREEGLLYALNQHFYFYRKSPEEALPRLAQIYILSIEKFKRAHDRLQNLYLAKARTPLSKLLKSLIEDFQMELEDLPRRYYQYSIKPSFIQDEPSPEIPATPLQQFPPMPDQQQWLTTVADLSRSLGYANDVIQKLEGLTNRPAQIEEPVCTTELLTHETTEKNTGTTVNS